MRREIAGSIVSGAINPEWSDDSTSFTYAFAGKVYRYDLATRQAHETNDAAPAATRRGRGSGRRGQGMPERGRQFSTVASPDGKRRAVTRDRNVYISDADGKNEIAVTTEGSAERRIKFGIASWVYGEELGVREAMWWSPDGAKLAFYKFDESSVPDYFIAFHQTQVQDTLDVEAYPKAGAPNPVVTLCIYDLSGKTTTLVETRFNDAALGEYVYDVRWSPTGDELLFNRTDRKQHTMQLCAANPVTGVCREIVSERQPQSWAENHPTVQFLKDNRRFIWSSERNGYKNFYLYDLDGHFLNAITNGEHDVDRIVKVDDDERSIWYTCRGGNFPNLVQLHRVGLDGKNDRRLTDPAFSHSPTISPDGQFFVDVAQALDAPPESVVRDAHGRLISELTKTDITKFQAMKLHRWERFAFLAADGKTTCYGRLSVPSDFDPRKKYPLIVSVYGGPESSGGAEAFMVPDAATELGFCVAWMDGRGTNGRGKAFRDAVYGKLGVVEIDDQAAGVRELVKRPYLDAARVGIQGTSYGGYSSVMALLRHPETFQVACASSPVTDWRNYDSIYTERFMGLPGAQENEQGYAAGDAKAYVANLRGKLMLFYGTADNNVHPSNTLQLIQAITGAGKRYDLQVGPDQGHSAMPATRMWEYFITHLIVNPPHRDVLGEAYGRRKEARAASRRAGGGTG